MHCEPGRLPGGVVNPTFEVTTVAEKLVPQRLANEFVHTLVHPTTAQVQNFLGYDVPRPRAPFVYTNDWGGVFSLLLPFVIAGWGFVRSLLRRNLLKALAFVSVIPVVFSLNRILWVCLVLAVIYGSLRFAMRGRPGAVQGIAALGIVFAALFTFGPARQLIEDRAACQSLRQRPARRSTTRLSTRSRTRHCWASVHPVPPRPGRTARRWEPRASSG